MLSSALLTCLSISLLLELKVADTIFVPARMGKHSLRKSKKKRQYLGSAAGRSLLLYGRSSKVVCVRGLGSGSG